MQDLELLKIRTKHYKPILNSLKKKKSLIKKICCSTKSQLTKVIT